MILGAIFLAIITFIMIALVLSLVMAFPTMLLWNWLMPVIFGLIKITFWQAFGLVLLSSILFKSSSASGK